MLPAPKGEGDKKGEREREGEMEATKDRENETESKGLGSICLVEYHILKSYVTKGCVLQ